MTAHERQKLPAAVACEVVSPSVSFDVSAPAIDPTSVTSNPSRIHVIPRATTTIQCHRLHGSRSSRAGMSVFTVSPVPPVTPSLPALASAVLTAPPLWLVSRVLPGETMGHAQRVRALLLASRDCGNRTKGFT